MAPGVGPLPAAGAEIDVAGPISRYVEGLAPRNRRQIKMALRVFDWLPFPWRFSRASIEARQGFLRDLDRSGLSFHQDVLLFLKVLAGIGYGGDRRVSETVGYEMRCAVSDGGPDR